MFFMMLKSIEAVFLRGVIAWQHDDNETAILARGFCRTHAGFECYEYPFRVLRSGSEEYFSSPPPEVRLDTYYSTALSLIPANVWFMKIDADQIYEASILLKVVRSVRSIMTVICFPRLNLMCRSRRAFVFRSSAVVNPCDQWVVFNNGVVFRMNLRRDLGGPWEEAVFLRSTARVSAPLMIYHFPSEKSWRRWNVAQHELILFSEWYSSAERSTRRSLNRRIPDCVCESLSEPS
jgi:hypothetical protein